MPRKSKEKLGKDKKGTGKKKKKKGKKGKKSKITNPVEREFNFIDDPPVRLRTPPTLYESYNTLPAVDSFFGQFLIGVETDERFDEFKPVGNKTLNLMLQQQSDYKVTSSRVSTASLMASASASASATSNKTNVSKKGKDDLPTINDLEGIDDPLPTSWRQRLEAAQNFNPQRKPFNPENGEIFVCNECENKRATHVWDDCGGQYFCQECVKEAHRPRYRNGLLGHTINSLQDLTELPYLENF